MNSPWGKVQHKSTMHQNGIYQVSTASHGGLLLTGSAATKYLSPLARSYGIKFGPYYCYEEDSLIAVAAFELYEAGVQQFKSQSRQALIESLSEYYPAFLIQKGIEPESLLYERFLKGNEAEQRHNAADPDLIVACWGDWETGVPGINKVCTASGAVHYIKSESYRPSVCTLLSECDEVLLLSSHSEQKECAKL